MEGLSEEGKAIMREYTGFVRKVLDTKSFQDVGIVDPDGKHAAKAVQIVGQAMLDIAGNRGTFSFDKVGDQYLLVERVARWSYEYLDLASPT